MDSVPLKVPQVVSQEVRQHVEVNVPDYLTILQETEVSVFHSSSLVVQTLEKLFTH